MTQRVGEQGDACALNFIRLSFYGSHVLFVGCQIVFSCSCKVNIVESVKGKMTVYDVQDQKRADFSSFWRKLLATATLSLGS